MSSTDLPKKAKITFYYRAAREVKSNVERTLLSAAFDFVLDVDFL
jgi:hypothetical protein